MGTRVTEMTSGFCLWVGRRRALAQVGPRGVGPGLASLRARAGRARRWNRLRLAWVRTNRPGQNDGTRLRTSAHAEDRLAVQAARLRLPELGDLRRPEERLRLRPAGRRAQAQPDGRVVARHGPQPRGRRRPRRVDHHAPRVWQATGHLAGFRDPLVDCKVCGERFRADKAPRCRRGRRCAITLADKGRAQGSRGELQSRSSSASTLDARRQGRCAAPRPVTRGYVCPNCGSPFLSDERQFNLMFRTSLGPVDPLGDIVDASSAARAEGLDERELREQRRGGLRSEPPCTCAPRRPRRCSSSS